VSYVIPGRQHYWWLPKTTTTNKKTNKLMGWLV
jgi:hypothetical protein